MEQKNELIHLDGTVEEIVYSGQDDNYRVLAMDVGGEFLSVVGDLGDIDIGERVSMYGDYVDHSKYGRQFKVEMFERSLPDDTESMITYLASGAIRGVGKGLAKEIVKAFGEKTFEILEKDPMRLASIKGITAEKAAAIGKQFREKAGLRNVMTFFSKYSVSQRAVSAAWKEFGNETVSYVSANPYILCREPVNLRVTDADKISVGLDFPLDSEERVLAIIIEILRRETTEGHCCMRESDLCTAAEYGYEVSGSTYYKALESGISSHELVTCDIYESRVIYLEEYYRAETYVSEKIAEMVKRGKSGGNTDFSDEIAAIEEEKNITYNTLQRESINGCMNNHVFILTGGPGTGKTTTLNCVIELCKRRKLRIKLAAPTGRAAKRMADLTGAQAQTIHRLLEVDFTTGLSVFRHNEENPLDCDVVIIDEMSMVDMLLFESLLRALRTSTRLILVGDSNQLPSVGAGNVLHDLIGCGGIPAVQLEEILRQAEKSLIVTNAHSIIHGEMPILDNLKSDFFFMPTSSDDETLELVADLCSRRLPQAYNYDPLDDIQVLALSRKEEIKVGTPELNKRLQNVLNPPDFNKGEYKLSNRIQLRVGDKVMQIRNDYNVEWTCGTEKSTGIYNGDIGKIVRADRENHCCEIDFEGRRAVYDSSMLHNIELAYAVTVHKSQGSEYPAVILALTPGMPRLSYRNLLYTAVTRAKDILIIAGSRNKIAEMVRNDHRSRRNSCLMLMLQDRLDD